MDEFHIPRKKSFASSPARAGLSAATSTSSIPNKGGDGGGDTATATPSKSKSSELMSSPDKSPGGRKILRRGDLVRLSNE